MALFEKQQRKLKRSARLISVMSKYGFKDLLIRLHINPDTFKSGSSLADQLTVYERVKLVLEELGPTFVKLGQSFSEREDLLPLPLIEQLRHLQDNVQTIDLDVQNILVSAFGEERIENSFKSITPTPLAAASIAQVYQAILKDDTKVIIKIKRPGIDAVIADDILILKDLVALIDTYSELAEQINLKNAIIAFEKSLLEELSLDHERKNIETFAENFKDNSETYVPKVYQEFSNNQVLTMEYIEGCKVTDVAQLQANEIDPVHISEVGYQLFVSQILDHGFFHADPHAGNIMVTKQVQLVFIDFGAVGKIPEMDKPLFENLILGFMAKKANKVVRILKKLSLYYKIPDERKFEMDVLEILNYVHNASLKDISVAEMMNKMKGVLQDNRLVMPEYFYLLFKGVSLMDGVGRQLNPDLDVVKSLKPYVQKIVMRRFNPENIAKQGAKKASDMLDNLEEIPVEIRSILSKLEDNNFSIKTESKHFERIEQLLKTTVINLILGLVLSANIIATALLINQGFYELVILSGLFSLFLTVLLLLRVLKR
jgi:ubiquinone biosynthesis protein